MNKFFLILAITVLSSGLIAQDIDGLVLTDAGTNTAYELSPLKSSKGAVIIFFGNRCAYNNYYISRINEMANEFAALGIKFILVNSNRSDVITEESPANMKRFLNEHQLKLPYLVDTEKVLKKKLGATRSPEVFLLQPIQGKMTIYYSGAIDDSPQSEGDISHPYLREALLSLLENGKPTVARIRPAGCLIR